MAAQQLGTSEASTSKATGGALSFLKEQMGGGEFSSMIEKLPGAGELMQPSAQPAASSAGGFGVGSLGALSGMMSGSGGVAGLASTLMSSGLDSDKIQAFVPMLAKFISDKAGLDVSKFLGSDSNPLSSLTKGLFG